MRATGAFTDPESSETLVRTWHVEGLAVRPDHRMIGHTGFLLTTRRLADGVDAPLRKRRPAKGSQPGERPEAAMVDETGDVVTSRSFQEVPDAEWTPEALGERAVSDKKVRRVRRDVGQAPEQD